MLTKLTRAEPRADGLEDLYREQAVAMIRLALMLTGDRATAEDVVQDAFLGLYRPPQTQRHGRA